MENSVKINDIKKEKKEEESNICSDNLTSFPGTENEYSKEKRRKVQKCTFCKNHSLEVPKKGHQCPFKECCCPLCNLQRKAQMTMRKQQRFWRHQKSKLRQASCGIDSRYLENIYGEKGQLCDMCRNHNKLTLKKNHYCPFANCVCDRCSLTFKRRELMKCLQRVRRSKLTSVSSFSNVSSNFWLSGVKSSDQRSYAETFCYDRRFQDLSNPNSLIEEPKLLPFDENSSSSFSNSSRDFYLKLNNNELIMEYKMLSTMPLQRIASPPPLIPIFSSPSSSPRIKRAKSSLLACTSPPSLDPLILNEYVSRPHSVSSPEDGNLSCNNLFHHSQSSQFLPKHSNNSTSSSSSRSSSSSPTKGVPGLLSGPSLEDYFSQRDRERFIYFFLRNLSSSNVMLKSRYE